MKILIATVKPFAQKARSGMEKILSEAGHEVCRLEKYTDQSQLREALAGVDGLIVRSDIVDADVIAAAHELKIIVRAGAGYDNIDIAAATQAGIVVMNTPGQNANGVAELALGLMLFMARGQFNPSLGTELSGKTIGIQAFGHVGRLVGTKAKALGMNVLAFDPFLSEDQIKGFGATPVGSLEELYSSSDYISLHIPSTPQTRGSINRSLISLMPNGATLVNTARKDVMDEADLLQMLAERPDLKYVADVAPDNYAALVEAAGTRVFATAKKMGAQTAEANAKAGFAAASQMCDWFATGNEKFRIKL